ncbi:hypothetical protein PR048_031292 [Dryococelus australis]|uniref:Uncharacterized protein n=1 Tax=Dryococelus australis TaxID=614101 RepID=A0ABQ9G4U7_9NEOP|nr:hypothetical protein PR048_031292 [Dryococelus australis]
MFTVAVIRADIHFWYYERRPAIKEERFDEPEVISVSSDSNSYLSLTDLLKESAHRVFCDVGDGGPSGLPCHLPSRYICSIGCREELSEKGTESESWRDSHVNCQAISNNTTSIDFASTGKMHVPLLRTCPDKLSHASQQQVTDDKAGVTIPRRTRYDEIRVAANEKQGHCDASPTKLQPRQTDRSRFYFYFPAMSDSSITVSVVKAVHDKVSTFEINHRKMSLPMPAYILTGALSDMRPVKLVTMDGKEFNILTEREMWATFNIEVWRVEYGAELECKGRGKGGNPRENRPTSGIVWHDPHVRESRSAPARNRTQFTLVGGGPYSNWIHTYISLKRIRLVTKQEWSSTGMKGRGKREIPKKTRRLARFSHVKIRRAAVAELLARSPPTKANRVQSPAGSVPDIRKWESCRTMPLVGGIFSGTSRFPALSFRRFSILTSLHPHRLSIPR